MQLVATPTKKGDQGQNATERESQVKRRRRRCCLWAASKPETDFSVLNIRNCEMKSFVQPALAPMDVCRRNARAVQPAGCRAVLGVFPHCMSGMHLR